MTHEFSLSQVKITPRHLERKAVIYIRQSSPKQVREHLDGVDNLLGVRSSRSNRGTR